MSHSINHPCRWPVAIGTASLTTAGVAAYVAVIYQNGQVNVFEWMSVLPFTLLFTWIAFSFALATLGFVTLSRSIDIGLPDRAPAVIKEAASRRPPAINSVTDGIAKTTNGYGDRTAILMPIYNESPESVFAGIHAMILSLRDVDALGQFDFYLLSDTTKIDVWMREEAAWAALVDQLSAESLMSQDDASRDFSTNTGTSPENDFSRVGSRQVVNVHYRHRAKNVARKAGNIADFVTRWGGRYEHMIVLDADSLMSGETMTEMVRRMKADAEIGILQVPPVPVGRWSVFARVQQFAASVYGPLFVAGFARFAGDEGNYWGHNAIIRVDAFRDHCDLPLLKGKAPLGGEILSHDFVEAALMLRAGYKVRLATDLDGSYEECPTTLADYAQRDQRWCQGNLQHSKLLISEKYRALSRLHFGSGVMAYVASPIWMVFMLLCVAGMVCDAWVHDENQTDLFVLPAALMLFFTSMLLLLTPKFWALLVTTRRLSDSSISRTSLCASAGLEVILSVLLSPIMAIYHTRFVLAALRGKNVTWSAQQRGEHGVSWLEATRQFGLLTIGGIALTTALYLFGPELLAWFSPLLAGLVVSIPLAVVLGSEKIGRWFQRWGLLMTTEEARPPQVCIYHRTALHAENQTDASGNPAADRDWFAAVIQDPKTYALHVQIQRASEVDVPLPTPQSKKIEAAFAAEGVDGIPQSARRDLLADLRTLRALHIESQVANLDLAQPPTNLPSKSTSS